MAATSHISTSIFGSPVTFLTDLGDRFALYMFYRKTVRELSALSRSELKDLGLSRTAIKRTAHEAVYGA